MNLARNHPPAFSRTTTHFKPTLGALVKSLTFLSLAKSLTFFGNLCADFGFSFFTLRTSNWRRGPNSVIMMRLFLKHWLDTSR
jgi:hypothetical protein